MPAAEQRQRMEIMQARLRRFDLGHWAKGFLAELAGVQPERARIFAKLLGADECRVIVEHYRAARRRLVVLDFDGTLVPITADPRDTKPSGALLSLLAGLTGDPANEVVLNQRPRSPEFAQLVCLAADWFGRRTWRLAQEAGSRMGLGAPARRRLETEAEAAPRHVRRPFARCAGRGERSLIGLALSSRRRRTGCAGGARADRRSAELHRQYRRAGSPRQQVSRSQKLRCR